MNKRLRLLVALAVGIAVLGVVGWLLSDVFHYYRFSARYESITVGSSRTEIEGLLGQGIEVKSNSVPGVMDHDVGLLKPVVEGDQIFRWKYSNMTIYVGFTKNKVTSKYMDHLGL